MKTSPLFYALKDKSLKSAIIHLLTLNWPQSTNDLHQAVKREFHLKISYQAVHKAVRQLQEDEVLLSEGKKYRLNEEWIKEVSRTIAQIESRYQGKFLVSKSLLNKRKGKFNVIIAKDGILRDKLHEQALVNYIREWVPILREELNPHNLFQKPEEEVLQYLLSIQKEHELFLALVDSKVIGGTVLEKKDESIKGDHQVWKFKHFAFRKGLNDDVEGEIMAEIEDRLRKKSKSTKIQLNLAQTESRYLKLFEKYGFKKEATLENHYRVGENMFIYSKLVKS